MFWLWVGIDLVQILFQLSVVDQSWLLVCFLIHLFIHPLSNPTFFLLHHSFPLAVETFSLTYARAIVPRILQERFAELTSLTSSTSFLCYLLQHNLKELFAVTISNPSPLFTLKLSPVVSLPLCHGHHTSSFKRPP